MIKANDICVVVSQKTVHKDLPMGTVVCVAGLRQLPEKSSDPYLTRTYTVCAKVDVATGQLMLPKSADDDVNTYLVDPRKLELCKDQRVLDKIKEYYENSTN